MPIFYKEITGLLWKYKHSLYQGEIHELERFRELSHKRAERNMA